MNKRIAEAFAHGKAFIPFITCGDPSLKITEELVYACEEAGADLIELGIPFSDPTAEGPVIQAANLRALSGGVTTDKIFDHVQDQRPHHGQQRPGAGLPHHHLAPLVAGPQQRHQHDHIHGRKKRQHHDQKYHCPQGHGFRCHDLFSFLFSRGIVPRKCQILLTSML